MGDEREENSEGENDEERLVHECCRVVVVSGEDGKKRY